MKFLATGLFAQDHHHTHSLACKHAHHNTSDEEQAIQSIMHEIDVATQGSVEEHTHEIKVSLRNIFTAKGLKLWVKSFNLSRSFKGVYAFYEKNKHNPATQEHLKNLVFIFPISHAIEMLAGPIMTSIGAMNGWPTEVLAAIGVTGTIITIPGIDPICILIYSAYPLKPVQNSITFMRKGTVSIVKFIGKYSGVSYLLKHGRNACHLLLSNNDEK